jgi:hypothetical protein
MIYYINHDLLQIAIDDNNIELAKKCVLEYAMSDWNKKCLESFGDVEDFIRSIRKYEYDILLKGHSEHNFGAIPHTEIKQKLIQYYYNRIKEYINKYEPQLYYRL